MRVLLLPSLYFFILPNSSITGTLLYPAKMVKKVLVGYGVDIDAVAGWLGSYGGEDSSSDISRGTYAKITFLPYTVLTDL